MGSSGGGDYSQPNTPAPSSSMVAGRGQTAPFKPNFINFLGDTNTPSTGLTPDMIAQIEAGNGQGGRPPPPQQQGGGSSGEIMQLRDMLSKMTAMRGQQPSFPQMRQRPERGHK